jgi:hypothetical protein
MTRIAAYVIAALALGLSACTNPYDPVQRGLGGGILGGPRLVPPSEQRQVAGQEPLLGRRSEGQPGYLGESLLHRHPHRAPISATRPTDIPPTDIRAMLSRATDIRATRDTPLTRVLLATAIQATRNIPPSPVCQSMDITVTRDTQTTQTTRATQLTPVHRPMDCHTTRAIRLTSVHRTIDCHTTRATRPTPVRRAMDCQMMWDARPTPVRRAMDTKATPYTLPTMVPVMDPPAMVIPAVLPRTGLLGLSTGSSLLAEFPT